MQQIVCACDHCGGTFIRATASEGACHGCNSKYCSKCAEGALWTDYKETLMQDAYLGGEDPKKVDPTRAEEWRAIGIHEEDDYLTNHNKHCVVCTEVPSMHRITVEEMLDYVLLATGSEEFEIRHKIREAMRSRLVAKMVALVSD